ncbi:hypothetical protein G7Y89_g933 [Cudoniella acicularis]|uniref:F-box domain-containing protein n=1 Tax=Cudoniella acicularis TaxID=354080 RepID=A0A8H4RX29_9HELO|nr:hypothetical protein G7Y89_g933 [Cudoniella acicularis]
MPPYQSSHGESSRTQLTWRTDDGYHNAEFIDDKELADHKMNVPTASGTVSGTVTEKELGTVSELVSSSSRNETGLEKGGRFPLLRLPPELQLRVLRSTEEPDQLKLQYTCQALRFMIPDPPITLELQAIDPRSFQKMKAAAELPRLPERVQKIRYRGCRKPATQGCNSNIPDPLPIDPTIWELLSSSITHFTALQEFVFEGRSHNKRYELCECIFEDDLLTIRDILLENLDQLPCLKKLRFPFTAEWLELPLSWRPLFSSLRSLDIPWRDDFEPADGPILQELFQRLQNIEIRGLIPGLLSNFDHFTTGTFPNLKTLTITGNVDSSVQLVQNFFSRNPGIIYLRWLNFLPASWNHLTLRGVYTVFAGAEFKNLKPGSVVTFERRSRFGKYVWGIEWKPLPTIKTFSWSVSDIPNEDHEKLELNNQVFWSTVRMIRLGPRFAPDNESQ